MNESPVILIPTYPFSYNSAGVYSQHKLCNILRNLGFNAHLVIIKGPEYLNEDWDTPIWRGTEKDIFSISIYSEIIKGNPLKTSSCIYWVMGDAINLSHKIKNKNHLLFWGGLAEEALELNNLDVDYFLPRMGSIRSSYAVYKGKNRNWKPIYKPGCDYVEIRRFGSKASSRSELRKILQESSALLIAEDSLVIEEAIIAGCPVIVEPGTRILKSERALPSLYLRSSSTDWPNEQELSSQIENSRTNLILNVSEREQTLENLIRIINSQIKIGSPLGTPRVNFDFVSIIQIKVLRVASAYTKGGIRSVFHLFFDHLKL